MSTSNCAWPRDEPTETAGRPLPVDLRVARYRYIITPCVSCPVRLSLSRSPRSFHSVFRRQSASVPPLAPRRGPRASCSCQTPTSRGRVSSPCHFRTSCHHSYSPVHIHRVVSLSLFVCSSISSIIGNVILSTSVTVTALEGLCCV